ncbi:hypothetical protein [Cyclobacterium qasimii]|uniref:Uncharacterized protein n=2 Tax=Cyclobacterium qasimii TaxID=1350429 RepID=S7VAI5_9BACT|nr:hypothetical protein [Cyclobacterium qasimii]EPR66976.1 hypothetical protein ADICYQ_4052 [Cyclobacterium qasimii M12-11B]GEO20227.1 hypothetical protein CQA01_07610 [Cyclobacterium qasimii]
MKGQLEHRTKNKEQENFSPVCFQNDPDIQEDYLLPVEKQGKSPNTSNKSTKKKNKTVF